MVVSQLIEELTLLKELHGDVQVCADTYEGIDEVESVAFYNNGASTHNSGSILERDVIVINGNI